MSIKNKESLPDIIQSSGKGFFDCRKCVTRAFSAPYYNKEGTEKNS